MLNKILSNIDILIVIALCVWLLLFFDKSEPNNIVVDCHAKRGAVIYDNTGNPAFCAVPPQN